MIAGAIINMQNTPNANVSARQKWNRLWVANVALACFANDQIMGLIACVLRLIVCDCGIQSSRSSPYVLICAHVSILHTLEVVSHDSKTQLQVCKFYTLPFQVLIC